MIRTLGILFAAAVCATALTLAPAHASAANCHFTKKEKIAMVSWVMIIPGAVITGLGCKRDLFNKGNKETAALPTERREQNKPHLVIRRRLSL